MVTALFVVFALLCAAGAYLAVRQARGHGAAAAGAAAVLAFFVVLFWWVASLLRAGGITPGGP
jgi:hypothetical protein